MRDFQEQLLAAMAAKSKVTANPTPFPWVDDPHDMNGDLKPINTRDKGWTKVRGSNGECVVGDIDVSTPEGEANLRLILTAPKLLEAVVSFLDMWHRAGPQGSHQFEKFDGVVRDCRKVIDQVRLTAPNKGIIMPPYGEAPSDWESPDWQSLSVVHEWKRYVSDRVRELWHSFTDEQKIALAQQADEIASKEEWD